MRVTWLFIVDVVVLIEVDSTAGTARMILGVILVPAEDSMLFDDDPSPIGAAYQQSIIRHWTSVLNYVKTKDMNQTVARYTS